MDDRHTLSDPRPVPEASIPTWEVDVFRDGVEDPVLTLKIDETTLPPRMRKKKVVWKLPDSADQTPNFGADEKKRILELFKSQKKTRRKLKRGSSTGGSDTMNGNTATETIQSNGTNGDHDENGGDGRQTNLTNDGAAIAEQYPPAPRGSERDADQNLAPQSNEVNAHGDHSDPMISHQLQAEPFLTSPADDPALSSENDNSNATRPAPLPPPGFGMMSLSLQETQPQAPPEPQRRLFLVPLSSISVPVDLAKIVVETYYPFLTHGRTDELSMYFFPGAKKSLSVGGAHAVCCSEEECLMQLQSLLGSQWEVRGVVAQPGVANSVVLLITGMVVLNAACMPFCHTMTLNKVETGYQIHNDALALLTDTAASQTAHLS